jgi:hypothetical protein
LTEPLVFVCIRDPLAVEGQPVARFVTYESPTGPVFMAFGSQELAEAVALLHGVAANVFLTPETHLSRELVGSLTEGRVVVLYTGKDFNTLTHNDFPWLDRVIFYDFAAALARQSSSPSRPE